ncbi:hypothetical protein [Parachlamydia acanthamoebae]|uniref:hypothetical protein n=1 Tax=Parachlamydia acanthamoebae TaxID=83552 RepID=UPI000AA4594F|nr:hypothetical protein [Parachlamydia acanthamoebae]
MTSRISEGPPASIFFDEKSKIKMQVKANEKIDRIVAESVKPVLHNATEECMTRASPCIRPAVKDCLLRKTPKNLSPCVEMGYDASYEQSFNSAKKSVHTGLDASADQFVKMSKNTVNKSIEEKPERMKAIFSFFFPEES